MPQISNFQKFLATIYEKYSGDAAKGLVHTSTIGWALSSLAQITMLATNKDISKKEKLFLIPQEFADAALNVGLYYLICSKAKDWAYNLVENGTIALGKTEELISRLYNNQNVEKDIRNYITSLVKFKSINETTKENILKGKQDYRSLFYDLSIKNLEQNKHISYNQKLNDELLEAQKQFKGFKAGVGVIATVGASVLASNVVTPILRNVFANKCQSNYKRKRQDVFKILNCKPISPIFNAFKV